MNRRSLIAVLLAVVAMMMTTSAFAAPQGKATRLQGSWNSSETSTFSPAPPPDATAMVVDGKASGIATHLGKYTATFKATVDLACGCSEGDTIRFVASNGDTLDAVGWGEGRPIAAVPGHHLVTQTYVITGGTGRFDGASGSLVVLRLVNLATGVSEGSFTGSLVLD